MNRLSLALAALLAFNAVEATAGEPGPAINLPAGVVKVARGEVFLERGRQRHAATVGSLVLVGDVVVTGRDGQAGITLRDNTLLSVGPDSSFSLKEYAFDASTLEGRIDATISRGTLSYVSGKIGKRSPEAVRVRTPVSVIGVRGTEFLLAAGEA